MVLIVMWGIAGLIGLAWLGQVMETNAWSKKREKEIKDYAAYKATAADQAD